MTKADHRDKPSQKTKPRKGKPIEIPVPKRGEVERDLLKIAKPAPRSAKS